ncbi:MAG: hypothetical protein ACRDTC_08320 [Pseudonocardiaceae bacterium]
MLTLPAAQRTHTIVTSLEQVRAALSMIKKPDQNAIDLAGAIEAFISERLTRDR